MLAGEPRVGNVKNNDPSLIAANRRGRMIASES